MNIFRFLGAFPSKPGDGELKRCPFIAKGNELPDVISVELT